VKTFLGIVVVVLVLIVGTWVAVFGGVGALLAKARDGRTMQGFWWGTLLGPIGWIVIVVRGRRSRRDPVALDEWLGDLPSYPSSGASESGSSHDI
jgi:hypothetical protein